MNNFKKIVLLFLLLFVFEQILGFALEPVTYQHYLELELKQKNVEDMQPDMAFIGNSRVMTSFIPAVFSEKLDGVDCAFNAGTGSQGIEGTYWYLKDILKQYDVKYMVLGLDYQNFLQEERVLKRDLVVLERIKSVPVKAGFILDVFEPSEYVYFLKSYQYRDEIWNCGENIRKKLSKEYRQGIYEDGKTVYENLGFAREKEVFGSRAGVYISRPWTEEELDKKRLAYLDRIIELCREEGVTLYAVSTPLTISTVCETPGYEECNRFFKQYLEERGIPYDNLNLMEDRGALLPDEKMSSMEHVGGDSAELVSAYYCEILQSRMRQESGKRFLYDSIAEMKAGLPNLAYCDFHTEKLDEAGNRELTAKAFHGEDVEVEYQFEKEAGGVTEILQSYGSQETCPLPIEKICFPMTLRVRCRVEGEETEKMFEIAIEEGTWE